MKGSERPIGIFDSGVGGLTVLRRIRRELPAEAVLYLGDTGRVPYGIRSPRTVERYSVENASFLLGRGIKCLVVACNTSSAVALRRLEEIVPVPVIGVIEPGARKGAALTRTGRVAVAGTEATIRSGAYRRALERLRPGGIRVMDLPCPLFVPLAEEGWTRGDVPERVARYYLEGLARARVDTLILGCTHYPLLRGVIREAVGPKVRLVDSARELSRDLKALLDERGIARRSASRGGIEFFSTDAPDRFRRVGSRFLGARIPRVEWVELGEQRPSTEGGEGPLASAAGGT